MKPRYLRLLSPVAVLCIILLACNFYNNYTKEEKEHGKEYRDDEDEREEEEMEGEREEENEAGMAQQMMSWFRSRAYPDPYYLNDKYAKAWEQAKKLREEVTFHQSRTDAAIWTSLGPSTGIGGRILSIAVNPIRGASMYVGSASGGIWKSYNSGANWRPVVTDFNTLGVPSIIINPLDTMIMYAGTGEVYRMDSTGATPNPGNTGLNVWKTRGTYGIGVLKSIDGGYTWDTVLYRSMSGLFGVQRLRFNPINPKTVYACTTEGLYRTIDAGNNWSKILNLSFVWDVVINARDTNQIVASVGNLQNTVKGIWRSTNNGSSFTKITSGLPSSFRGFIRLDNVPATGSRDTIVASIGVDETGSPDELYRSVNFGNTWVALTSSTHCSYQFWSAHAVAINPSNPNKLIYAGVNTFSYTLPSLSGSIGGIHADIHDIKFDPSNSNIVYIACDGGMYRSNNGGTSFASINNGLAATQFYATIGVSGSDPNLIIGGLQDNNVYMTTNGGASWSTFPNANADGAACAIDPTNDNNIIASIDARGFYRSTNRGASSSSVMSYLGGPHDSRTAFVAPVVMCRKNPSIVYVGTDNLHKSTNGGATWSNNVAYTGNTAPNNWIEAVHKTAIAMEIPPSDPTGDTLYVSTSPFAQFDNDADGLWVTGQPNILKTTNGATPFTSIKGTLPNRFVMDFAISKTNRDSVYIVLGGFGTSHVYVSANGGGNWNALGASLPDVPFNTIVFDPVNPKIIYAGCDFGVYVSSDRGITWVDFNNGFWDATQVVDLQISADNKLIAATHGKGIFKTDLFTSLTLPVRLLDFGGSNKNNYNELHWTVAQEQNLSHYELERSVDGQRYQTINSKISGNSLNPVTYRYNDPVSATSSEYYYRLKIVDNDRSYTYSAVIFIRTVMKNKFTIVNSPFHDYILLQYHITRDQTIHVDVFNAAGELLKTKELAATAGTGIYTIYGVDSYPRGMYLVRIAGHEGTQSFKLVKY